MLSMDVAGPIYRLLLVPRPLMFQRRSNGMSAETDASYVMRARENLQK